MATYWSDFIAKNLSELPYWTLEQTLEKFYDYLTEGCNFRQGGGQQ